MQIPLMTLERQTGLSRHTILRTTRERVRPQSLRLRQRAAGIVAVPET